MRQRFLDGEGRRERLQLDDYLGLGGRERPSARARQQNDWLADVLAQLGGQEFFVVKNGPKRVLHRNVRVRINANDSVHAPAGADVKLLEAPMRQRAADKVQNQLVFLRNGIVDEDRFARDMVAGGIVRN